MMLSMLRTCRQFRTPVLLCIAASVGTASNVNAQLAGATVSIGVYCCTAPTPPYLSSNVVTGTVPVSFPVGSLYTTVGGSTFVIPVSFDISATQIIGTFASPVASAPGTFNGYVFAFSGLASPITGVTVDPLSTFIPRAVTFGATSIQLDAASQLTSGRFIFDVAAGVPTTVPEPTSFVLVGAGVIGAAAGVRRRRRVT